MYSKNLSSSLLVAVCVTTLGCATATKYPHEQVSLNQKIGVYAHWFDESKDTKIKERLQSLAVHKLVLKSVMQSYPSRTNATVQPILGYQAIFSDDRQKKLDVVRTGKALSLDYVMILKTKSQLKTTGYHFQEKWRPELQVTTYMIRVKDGQNVMQQKISLNEKPFMKYMSPTEEGEALNRAYGTLASRAAETFSETVGPVIRTIPEKEKMIQEKIYAFGHIRTLAHKNNCIISGDLTKETTDTNVIYHVPCRDITLTYACETESDSSRCWLQ